MKEKKVVCIVCPIGCRLNVYEDSSQEKGYNVEGNKCPRGKVYGIKEMTNPTRMLPTTVVIKNAFLSRLPVITNQPVPKPMIFECMKVINSIEVEAPVKIGDILVENILDTGVDIVATRSMDRK
ncbi:MAG: DUF1667 domain-containing protein [Bacillota bacterium]|nr:DUF1667 domain-containing protein [Bacillota bacterium]